MTFCFVIIFFSIVGYTCGIESSLLNSPSGKRSIRRESEIVNNSKLNCSTVSDCACLYCEKKEIILIIKLETMESSFFFKEKRPKGTVIE